MRRRSLLCLLAAATMVATASGCTVQRYWGGSSSEGGGTVKIGLVTKTNTNPYFVELRNAANAEARKQGAELTALAGQFDGDNAGQVAAIENLMQQGATTILITPNSSTGVLAAIDKARKAGILVIALDTATDPASAVDATIATDNTAAGRKQGQYVKAALEGDKPRLLMIDGTAGSSVDTERHTGFLQGMGISDGDPTIAGHDNANGDQSIAQQKTENLLQRSSDVNAVYTMNEPSARGAHAAVKARNLDLVMGSIDGGCEGIEDVRAGRYAVTVMQFPSKMAAMGVDAAVKYARTGAKPHGFVDTGSQIVTDEPMPGVPSKDTDWGLENCWGSK